MASGGPSTHRAGLQATTRTRTRTRTRTSGRSTPTIQTNPPPEPTGRDDEDEDEDEDTDERTIDTDDTDEPAARTDGTTAERSDRGTGGTAAGGADDGNDGAIVSADDGTLPPSLIATPATAAALLYAVTLFFNNATLKRDGDTWTDGEALLYALRQDHMTILLGNHLAESPALLEVGSYVWFGLLVASPLLLVLSGPVRLAYAGVFLVTVAGMSVSMAVGLFPALLAALLLLFLPTPVWDTLERAGTTALGRLGVRADLRAAARRIDGPRRLRSEAPRVGVSNRQ
ncbi:HTTM domain-containing protein [Halobiforma nitratireducens JCM 10879]|uniref:HTTM domain-containing protein n=1 Tax=Halobiforma nitratireducens JCM 10879 TaxID=1227454 RepID=M0M9E8_9EURY|nr:HTTM domain-containing protein [Halobiforma nitratireducens JCM 10879]